RAHLDSDLLRRDRVCEESRPEKIAATPLWAKFCRVELVRLKDSERREPAEVDRLRRPEEQHGKGNRCTLNDSLLQSLPRTGVLRAEQRDLIAIPLINVAVNCGNTARFQNLQDLCVGQRFI